MTSSLGTRVMQGVTPLAVLAFLCDMNTGSVYACTPALPTPWFAGKLEISSTPVPQNIAFTEYEIGSLKLQNPDRGRVRTEERF